MITNLVAYINSDTDINRRVFTLEVIKLSRWHFEGYIRGMETEKDIISLVCKDTCYIIAIEGMEISPSKCEIVLNNNQVCITFRIGRMVI